MLSVEIENLCQYCRRAFHLSEEDLVYSRNLLCAALRVQPRPAQADRESVSPDELLKPLAKYAAEAGLISEEDRELFGPYLISLFLPRPSEVIAAFSADRENLGVREALARFYRFCIDANYIRMGEVEKNLVWNHDDPGGQITVTVNKSKPEKDNREIARLAALPPASYPKCMLCLENLGYAGRAGHPARENLRVIPLELCGEKWYLQYSPYVYYNEHCIVFSAEHRPMCMDRSTFDKLSQFVDRFPCYFLGSNACIPIVGGSILTHEHFQGGGYRMPLFSAGIRRHFRTKGKLTAGIADWHNSTLRIRSESREAVVEACDEINKRWREYSNPALSILARTDREHNAVTPILRKEGEVYIADLILRNNRTDERYPDGIFHAHPEFHGVKKEGIGLIEAMGLFVLPGRLDRESQELAACLVGGKTLPPDLAKHARIYNMLRGSAFSDEEEALEAVRREFGNTCVSILQNTAVFKADEEGQSAFGDFAASLSFLCRD